MLNKQVIFRSLAIEPPHEPQILETHFVDLWVDSVTRLGDLLYFGQLFKANGNNYFAQNAHIFQQFL